jgi:hypothetical protein
MCCACCSNFTCSAPTEVTISGTPHSLSLAVSMVTDIVKGTFKGFALLRQMTNPGGPRAGPLANPMAQPRPVYAPGYGLIPPSQVRRARLSQGWLGAIKGLPPASYKPRAASDVIRKCAAFKKALHILVNL